MARRTSLRTVLAAGAVPLGLVLAIGVSGCSNSNDQVARSAAPSAATPSARASDATHEGNTDIVIEVDGREIAGTLDDSATSRSLISRLPLTLSFRDYGGQEKVADLPQPLDLAGAPDESSAEPAAIGYYSPQQRLVLYYDHVGTFSGIVPIGSYDNDDVDVIRGENDSFSVTIRTA